jgi:hypothetical protein
MADVAKEPWYHGSIPRGIAEERLDKSAIGTFLVRESESRPGYSLSIKYASLVAAFVLLALARMRRIHLDVFGSLRPSVRGSSVAHLAESSLLSSACRVPGKIKHYIVSRLPDGASFPLPV